MTRLSALIAFLALLAACSPKQEPLPPDQYTPLVLQLGDKDFATRDAADRKLRDAGWSAMTTLIAGKAESRDPEVQARIGAILEHICWNTNGLPPESAKRVSDYLSTLQRFNGQPPGAPIRSPIDLRQLGPDDSEEGAILWRANAILGTEPLTVFRDGPGFAGFERAFATMRRHATWDELEWSLICTGTYPEVAFEVRRRGDVNHLLRAITALRNSRPNSRERLDQLTLAAYMGAGRKEDALKLAKSTGHQHFVEQILAEKQDWDALAKFPITHDFFNISRFIPGSALLFSGETAQADAIIDANSKAANGVEPVGLQRQVVLLGRIELINKACVQRGDSDTLVEFLLRERRYSEAMSHHSKPGAPRTGKDAWPGGTISSGGTIALGPADAMDAQLDSRLLLALIKLNELDRARAEIKRLDAAGAAAYWLNQADLMMGDTDAVLSRLKTLKPDSRPDGDQIARMFDADFFSMRPWAELVWRDTQNAEVTFDKLDKIHRNVMLADELQRIINLHSKLLGMRDFPICGDSALIFAAYRFEMIGRNDLAFQYLNEYANGPLEQKAAPALRRGFEEIRDVTRSILALKNSKLPQQFLDAFVKRPDCDPSIQFLAGVYQARAGNVNEGNKLEQDAELHLGGDVARRLYLAQTLRALGETDLARAQAELITQIDEPVGTNRLDAHDLLAQIDQEQGHFADALQHYRLAFYADFFDSIRIPEPYERYFRLPRNAAYCESRAALEKSDTTTALHAATDVVNLDPEGLELTAPLIIAFKVANLENQASSLANLNRSLLENILKDFPNSHFHHYLIAKLDLETGFTNPQTHPHLEKALQLAPQNPDYQKLQQDHPK